MEEQASRHELGARGSHAAREAALNDPSTSEYQKLQALKTRDREVRAHEMAHQAAAGSYARGGPFYDFERGADGRRYAVGGHVNIDTSPVPGNPEATLRKAEQVQRAVLAPAEPSPQDRRVAAEAVALATEARMEIAVEIHEKQAAGPESTSRDGEHYAKEKPKPEAIPPAAYNSLAARLAASGALPEDELAAPRIDLHS